MKLIIILLIILVLLYLTKEIKSVPSQEKELFDNSDTSDKPIDYSIKSIKPVITINPDADIAFVYLYTPNIYDYCQHSIKNLTAYVKKYNYGLVIYNQSFNDSVSPCWNKVIAVMENLPKHKYVIWFDADAIVNNFNIPITNFINKYPQANLIACYDIYKEKECMNSGIMIIKNTEWSNNLFKKTWESKIPHGYNDQNAIFYTLIEDLYPGATQTLKNNKYCTLINDSKVVLLEENAFNTNIQSYRPGDFIIHLMGVSKEGRINCMRQVNTALGLDNYDKKECINLINKYTGLDKIEKIRDICLTKNI